MCWQIKPWLPSWSPASRSAGRGEACGERSRYRRLPDASWAPAPAPNVGLIWRRAGPSHCVPGAIRWEADQWWGGDGDLCHPHSGVPTPVPAPPCCRPHPPHAHRRLPASPLRTKDQQIAPKQEETDEHSVRLERRKLEQQASLQFTYK